MGTELIELYIPGRERRIDKLTRQLRQTAKEYPTWIARKNPILFDQFGRQVELPSHQTEFGIRARLEPTALTERPRYKTSWMIEDEAA